MNSIKNKIIDLKRKETSNKEEELENIFKEYKNKAINRLTFIKIRLKCYYSKLSKLFLI